MLPCIVLHYVILRYLELPGGARRRVGPGRRQLPHPGAEPAAAAVQRGPRKNNQKEFLHPITNDCSLTEHVFRRRLSCRCLLGH